MDSNIPSNRNIYICTECGTVETYIVSENGELLQKKDPTDAPTNSQLSSEL